MHIIQDLHRIKHNIPLAVVVKYVDVDTGVVEVGIIMDDVEITVVVV